MCSPKSPASSYSEIAGYQLSYSTCHQREQELYGVLLHAKQSTLMPGFEDQPFSGVTKQNYVHCRNEP